MGQEQSLVTVKEGSSSSSPGRACYVTSSLDDLYDYDRLWNEIATGVRTDHSKDSNILKLEVRETGPSADEFELVKTYEGKKIGMPVPEVVIRIRYVLNKVKGEVYEEELDPLHQHIGVVRVARILRDPLRIEMMAQKMHGAVRTGPLVQGVFGDMLKVIFKRDIELFPNRECRAKKAIAQVHGSPVGIDCLCIETEPLQDFMSFDEVCEGLFASLKSQEYNKIANHDTVRFKQLEKDDLREKFQVWVDLDKTKIKEHLNIEPNQDEEIETWRIRVESEKVNPDGQPAGSKDNPSKEVLGVIVYIISDKSNFVVDSTHYVVYKGPPVIMECWAQSFFPHEMTLMDSQKQDWDGLRIMTFLTLYSWAHCLVERASK